MWANHNTGWGQPAPERGVEPDVFYRETGWCVRHVRIADPIFAEWFEAFRADQEKLPRWDDEITEE